MIHAPRRHVSGPDLRFISSSKRVDATPDAMLQPSNAFLESLQKRCAAKHRTISVGTQREVSQDYGKSVT